ncbi:serine hydrolase domain-containing protein [Candidatus Deianiraea vastatrix]|uniref:PbpE-like serine hydrolase n=1 Tax=Candidatus Deianiraea vastatrix TaxID=2163644 RepID=A0A5B8XCP5_9RICK|nr:serine hydrolase domain-containing protein [Candidatus Deianiraea vastatrix]QED22826.1 Putative PbpE-like serine hydrolase [Candidatus Deianiraea vastatrix]
MKILFTILCLTFCNKSFANECVNKIFQNLENNTASSPAAAVLIIKDNVTIFKKTFGYKNIEQKIPADLNTKFALCSLTKQFTAQAILLLEERKLLSINDKVSKYLNWLPKYAQNITIKHLLFNTSGIPDYVNDNKIAENGIMPQDMMDKNIVFNDEYIKQFIITEKPKFKYATSSSYSNSGYWLLGKIIEKISHTTYRQFINNEILSKIGIQSYDKSENTPYQEWPLFKAIPNYFETVGHGTISDAGLNMSISDFETYARSAILDNKIFQYEKTHDKFISNSKIKIWNDTTYYGYGLIHSDINGNKIIYHDGMFYGLNTYMLYMPSKNLFITTLFATNTNSIYQIPLMIERCFNQ